MSMKDMLGRGGLVPVGEARRLIIGSVSGQKPRVEEVDTDAALGRVLAQDVTAPESLPGFARSSMDGYAVRAADTFGATESMPGYLEKTGEVAMGEEASAPVTKGGAIGISTGGMLPPGADAVVMLEHTQLIDGRTLEVSRPAAPGENVVQAGDDVKEGERLLDKGRRLRAHDLGALAGIGVTKIRVAMRPVVAIINTGNEIVPASRRPGPGQVRDVNSYNLRGLIEQAGGAALWKGLIKDDLEAITAAVGEALEEADIVAITGGSSVGARDMTAKVIQDFGPPGVLLHGVAVRPGKPLVFGMSGGMPGGKPLFGLPGHPVAVSVCFSLFIAPLIRGLLGEVDRLARLGIPPSRVVRARMARSYPASQGREDHLRVWLDKEGDELIARPVLGKSGLIMTLVRADGMVVIPAGKQGLEKGEWVEVELFD